MTRFTDALWAEIQPTYEAILDLPFNRELAAGTLSRERFIFYMVQDAHYLTHFARALAVTAARAPDADALIRAVRGDPALPDLCWLQRLPARHGLPAPVPGRGRRAPALLPDLLRGRQAPLRDRGGIEPLPTLDRHLPRRGLR